MPLVLELKASRHVSVKFEILNLRRRLGAAFTDNRLVDELRRDSEPSRAALFRALPFRLRGLQLRTSRGYRQLPLLSEKKMQGRSTSALLIMASDNQQRRLQISVRVYRSNATIS